MSDRPIDPGNDDHLRTGATGTRNGKGTAALVVGLIALVLAVVVFPLGVILGIVAVVLGALGRKAAKRGEASNGSTAVAGLAIGAVAIAIGVLVGIFVGSFIADNADEISNLADCLEQADTDQEADDCAAEFEDQVVPADE